MEKPKIYAAIMFGLIIFAVFILIYIFMHSPGYVTHAELYVAISALIIILFGGFNTMWSRMIDIGTALGRIGSELRHAIEDLIKEKLERK